MKISNIFYSIGIFFIFITIIYFLGTYLNEIPSEIKVIISFLFSILLFLIGMYLERRNI